MKLAGGCHCGAVRFEAVLRGPREALSCNCSVCIRTGFVHWIVPGEDFALLTGERELVDYRFGTRQARHRFCRICGVKSFYEPRSHPGSISVHIGCLDEGPDAWSTEPFDGRNWEEARRQLDG